VRIGSLYPELCPKGDLRNVSVGPPFAVENMTGLKRRDNTFYSQ
jgi:hypothetical protein